LEISCPYSTYFEITSDDYIIACNGRSVYKYDMTGNRIWTKGFQTNGDHMFEKVHETIDRGCVFVSTYRDPGGDNQLFLAKLDQNGKLLWDTKINPTNTHNFAGREVYQTNDQGFIAIATAIDGYLYLFKYGSGSTITDLDIIIDNGKGVNAYLRNTGDTVISNIDWSLDVEDGFILFKTNPSGSIDEIAPGEIIALDRLILFGFGMITIKITINEMISSVRGLLFVNYVLI